jgi:hypothetical protein
MKRPSSPKRKNHRRILTFKTLPMKKTNEKDQFDPRWNGCSIPARDWHFHRQLLVRYGIVLCPGEYARMVKDIKAGFAELIEMRSVREAIYSVKLHHQHERIYVLSNGQRVFTAWPPTKRLNEIRRKQRSDPPFYLRLRLVRSADDDT